ALVYVSTGRPAEAEEILRKAVSTQPQSLEAKMALGRFYYTEHRLADGEAVMRAAAEADAHGQAPRLLLAQIYIHAAKVAEAEQVCAELKNRIPNDPEAYGALASFYESTGQKEKALAELQALAAGRPKDSAVRARLTDTLIDLNRIHEAATLNQELLGS